MLKAQTEFGTFVPPKIGERRILSLADMKKRIMEKQLAQMKLELEKKVGAYPASSKDEGFTDASCSLAPRRLCTHLKLRTCHNVPQTLICGHDTANLLSHRNLALRPRVAVRLTDPRAVSMLHYASMNRMLPSARPDPQLEAYTDADDLAEGILSAKPVADDTADATDGAAAGHGDAEGDAEGEDIGEDIEEAVQGVQEAIQDDLTVEDGVEMVRTHGTRIREVTRT